MPFFSSFTGSFTGGRRRPRGLGLGVGGGFSLGQQLSVHSYATNAGQDLFNPDGTKWFIAAFVISGSVKLRFEEYALSTAYDLSTATLTTTVDRSFPGFNDVDGMTFNDDGTELLVKVFMQSGQDPRSRAYTFTLGTAYDFSTISGIPGSYVDTARAGGWESSEGHGLAWSNDGLTLFVAAHTSRLKQVTVSSAYDVSTITSVTSISSLDLGVDASAFWGVVFNDNGTVGYLLESQGSTQELFSFDLSTPFDFTTATLNTALDIDETSSYNINYPLRLSRTDSSLIVHGIVTGVGTVYTYIDVDGGFASGVGGGAATYTISGATQSATTPGVGAGLKYINYNSDGTKILTSIAGQIIYEISLSTAYDISSGTWSYTVGSGNIGTKNIDGARFSADGTTVILCHQGTPQITQYNLTSAFDISNISSQVASLDITGDIPGSLTFVTAVAFNNDGTKLFATEMVNDLILEYSLGSAYDISTASYTTSFDYGTATGGAQGNEMIFNSTGSKLLLTDNSSDILYEIDLSTGFDLSTATYNSNNIDFSSIDLVPLGLAYNSDESKLYVSGGENTSIYTFDLVQE